MIFPWRIVAKAVLLRILPPIFRATSVFFDVELPARRHYRQATSDYSGVPPTPIRSLPSFIDLHAGTPPEVPSADNTPVTSTSHSPLLKPTDFIRRQSSSDVSLNGDGQLKVKLPKSDSDQTVSPVGAGRGKRRNRIDRAKYDAEGEHDPRHSLRRVLRVLGRVELTMLAVLTKVGVYSGIGFLVVWGSPFVFEFVESALGL